MWSVRLTLAGARQSFREKETLYPPLLGDSAGGVAGASAAGGGGGGTSGSTGSGGGAQGGKQDDVLDAEFEEVKESDRKKA